MFEAFKTRAEGVGAEVHRVATREEALLFIRWFLETERIAEAPGSGALWAKSALLDGVPESEIPRHPGLSHQVTRDRAACAKVGISEAQWAVADTGSLVLDQSAPEQRLVSSLPTIHLALLPTGNILADKAQVFQKMNPANSKYIAFITGPSRTADIERVLTIGVHGPERLVIVCIDDLEGGIQ